MNETQRIIALDDEVAWRDALVGLDVGPAHLHWYNNALSQGQDNDIFLYSFRNEMGGVAALPLVDREFHGYRDVCSPYGNSGFQVSGEMGEFWATHRAFMGDQGFVCAHVSLNQIDPAERFLPDDAVEFLKPVFVVDTSADEDTLWRNFGQNNRRQIRNWRAGENVRLIEDHGPLRKAFLDLYPSFVKRLGVDPRHCLSTTTLEIILEQNDNVKLFGIEEAAGEISFVRCFLFTEHSAEAFMEASTEIGRHHSRLVYWTAYQWAHEVGIPKLNLSGGIKLGDSLEFFKKNLGGDRRALYRARLIYDDALYRRLCHESGVDAGLLAGEYFPPYRG